MYSCLESMFDEDEARGLGVDPTGGGGGGGNINNNTNDDGDSSNSGKRVAAAAVEQDKDKGKGRANGRGKDRVGASTPAASGSNKTKVRAAAIRAWYCVGVGLSRTRVASERPMDTVRKMGGEYSIWCFRNPRSLPAPVPSQAVPTPVIVDFIFRFKRLTDFRYRRWLPPSCSHEKKSDGTGLRLMKPSWGGACRVVVVRMHIYLPLNCVLCRLCAF